ncbi:mucin-19-like [Dermacentor silvarum]|uniref:mucin-19-like n=1 Tax=Dermacentor silvarum TaxID=543639 RepID=UPI00189BBB0A|nr:mucin-19-like [Dermacentor silvarum]
MGDPSSLPELAPKMGDDILQGVAELRPGTPQARSRALNLLLKEASRMFPSPQASQEGTPKRLSPTFLKGAALRTRSARRIPRRHLKMTELQSPAERDDTTSSSSPSSSRTSSSSPADGVDSAASSTTSRPSSPSDGSSTCSPAASPLGLGGETREEDEPPSTTEGDPGTSEQPQPRDSHTPSPSSAPRGEAAADGTAGHEAAELGRSPATPLDGEHTMAAESLPRAAGDEGAGGCHGVPAPDNESSTPRSPAASSSSRIAGADGARDPNGAAGQQQRGFSAFLPPIPEVAEPEESRPPCAIVTGASPAAAPASGTTAHAPTSPSHLRPVADDGANGGPSPLAPSQRLSASSPPRAAKQKKKKKKGKNINNSRARSGASAAGHDGVPPGSLPKGSAGGNQTHLLGPRPKPSAPSRVPATVSPTPEDPASCQTVLYRPTSRKAHFLATSRDAIAAFLSGVPGAHRVRANIRRNVVAVDALAGADLTALLAVRVISDVHVRAKALALNTCCGTLFAVDPAFDESTIIEGLESSAPVLSAPRNGDDAVLRFAGSMVPAAVHLFRQRRVVYPRLPRPLQCGRCGLFGHATVTCHRDERCLRCAGRHPAGACTAERARCLHCGGPHAASEPSCPNWQLERRVACILDSTQPRITRRQALTIARNAAPPPAPPSQRRPTESRVPERRPSAPVQPGRSFRDALTGDTGAPTTANNSGPAQPPSTTTQDARGLVATTTTTTNNSAPARPPSTPTQDTRALVATALASALRAALHSVPADSPVRHMCVAALAMHDALAHHG